MKIDHEKWQVIGGFFGTHSLCRGEEKTLTPEEVEAMNTLLREIEVRTQGVRAITMMAKARFAR